MAIDPSHFETLNVADTCSIWNVLSSRLLYVTARSVGCLFCCTEFVYYECLYKARKNLTKEDVELQNRLRKECQNGDFNKQHLDIEDLQDVALLQKRKNLSKGELASIALAKKKRQAFLTDDKKARKLAEEVMEQRMVQTVPHLLGWLYFTNCLGDSDLNRIIEEHEECCRPLASYFKEMYLIALQYRSLV